MGFWLFTMGLQKDHKVTATDGWSTGFGKPCSYSLYIPLYSHGLPARDEMLLDTFNRSTIKRTFIFFMELSPLAQPPLSSTTVTTTTPLSQPPQLTKASFSHLPLSVPTTHSGNTWALPCLALACCSSWKRNVRQEKTRFSASNGPASGREGLCHFLVVVSFSFGLSVGTPGWIKKKLQNNDSGKPSLLGILNAVLNKAWGCRGKRKAQTPKGIEERAVSRAPTLFLLQGKTLFFPFSSMACCH